MFSDLLSQSITKKAFEIKQCLESFILSYIFVLISAVQRLNIMEKKLEEVGKELH